MELPKDYQPPIQPIDTWHVSRKLGMLIEARVLNGRLLMTTMDIGTDLGHRIVARQMRVPCFAMSIITDLGVPGKIVEVSHEEVQKVAAVAESKMTEIFTKMIERL